MHTGDACGVLVCDNHRRVALARIVLHATATLSEPQQRGESGVRAVHTSTVPLQVVLAEDDPDLRHVLEALLEDAGVRVTTVVDVSGLRALLERMTPDVLLTDFHLADGTVEELLWELVEEQRVERIHVLSASPLARIVAARVGVSFLAKPFDLEALLALVRPDRPRAA